MNSPLPRAARRVEQRVTGQATTDGAGVKLTRVLTQDLQQRLDPFLMLDNFSSDDPDDYIAGFPDHPHRGFETVTYMIDGRMRHRDSAGHEGLLGPGGVQWMTTGRGLVHSEIPEQSEGVMEGFQLWLNLPGRDKLCAPSYRDIPGDQIPEVLTPEGVRVRVIAGHTHGVEGAVARPAAAFPTETLYLDLVFPEHGAVFDQALPAEFNAFVYVYRGRALIEGTDVPPPAGNDSHTATRALLIAGRPLHEPIAQYGPFVMNTREQLIEAVEDFQSGRLR